MAGRRRTPVFTQNLVRNMDAIQSFLGPEGARAFSGVLDRLFNDIVPLLCRCPQSGRSFLTHPARSRESWTLIRKLKTKMKKGDDLREYIMDDYLFLYLRRGTRVILLSIKHHRQLSFDLLGFWS